MPFYLVAGILSQSYFFQLVSSKTGLQPEISSITNTDDSLPWLYLTIRFNISIIKRPRHRSHNFRSLRIFSGIIQRCLSLFQLQLCLLDNLRISWLSHGTVAYSRCAALRSCCLSRGIFCCW